MRQLRQTTNTREIIEKTAKSMNCFIGDADDIIRIHLFKTITQELINGKEVHIAPYGKFYLKDAVRPQANGIKRKIVKFEASQSFQAKIDKGDISDDI